MTAARKTDPTAVRLQYALECRRGERGARTRAAAALGITPARVGQILQSQEAAKVDNSAHALSHTDNRPPAPPMSFANYVTPAAYTFVLPKDDPFRLQFGIRLEGEPTPAELARRRHNARQWLLAVRVLLLAGTVLIPAASAAGADIGACVAAIGVWLVVLACGREGAAYLAGH